MRTVKDGVSCGHPTCKPHYLCHNCGRFSARGSVDIQFDLAGTVVDGYEIPYSECNYVTNRNGIYGVTEIGSLNLYGRKLTEEAILSTSKYIHDHDLRGYNEFNGLLSTTKE